MKKQYFKLLLVLTIIPFIGKASISHVSTPINLNSNATNSANIVILGKTINFSFWSFGASGFQIDGNNDFQGLVDAGTSNLTKLNNGDGISNASSFVAASGYAPAYHGSLGGGVIADGASTYFGFRVVSGGNTHYAWLKMTKVNDTEAIINEYAYETTASMAINAGDDGSSSSILLTSITVVAQGGASSISTLGGSLQMSASVLPANATDNSVTWSVTNGTGSASISSTGLLTASNNGSVTVTATANDASGIVGTKEITISNQESVGIKDLNDEDISIYPNPVNDFLNISLVNNLEINNIFIYSIEGKLLLNEKVSRLNKRIDIKYLNNGLYVLILSDKQGNVYSQQIQKIRQ